MGAGNILAGIGHGMKGVGQSIANAQMMYQQAEQLKLQKQSKEMKLSAMRFGSAMKMKPSLRKKIMKSEQFKSDYKRIFGADLDEDTMDMLNDESVQESIIKLMPYAQNLYSDPKQWEKLQKAITNLGTSPTDSKMILDGLVKYAEDFSKIQRSNRYYDMLERSMGAKTSARIPVKAQQLNKEKSDISNQLGKILQAVRGLQAQDEDDPKIKELMGRARTLRNLWNVKNNQLNAIMQRGKKVTPRKATMEEIVSGTEKNSFDNESVMTGVAESLKNRGVGFDEASDKLGEIVDAHAEEIAKDLGVDAIDEKMKKILVMSELKKQGF